MILPIYVYGNRVLREPAAPVDGPSSDLRNLAEDMIETMHAASGIGLAAPQVGRSERMFVIDLSPLAEDLFEELGHVPEHAEGPMVLVNPTVQEVDAASIAEFEEGCLSIPDIRESVRRPDRVLVRFLDLDFEPNEFIAEGLLARVVQHEFDHLEGILFVDRISSLRRRMLKRRLRAVARGEVEADYELAIAGG